MLRVRSGWSCSCRAEVGLGDRHFASQEHVKAVASVDRVADLLDGPVILTSIGIGPAAHAGDVLMLGRVSTTSAENSVIGQSGPLSEVE